MVTWRNASQAAGQLQNAILTDGQHWYALVDDEHAVKDVAGDVEILLRGGGEASTQVHSAWFMQRNVKVFLEALAAPDDASSPGVRTHWASDNILYRLSWGPATAAEEELMLGPPAAILTMAKLSAAYFEPPARHDAILAAGGPALVKQLDRAHV